AGVTYGVRFLFENTGAVAWQAHPSDGHPVKVLISVDDALLDYLSLPVAEVAPGQQVTLHFPFRAHDTVGPHRVRVELVHEGAARFADLGVDPWIIDVRVVSAAATESVRMFELSRKHNPWYYNPLQGVPESRNGHPFPLFISRAKGCKVWDPE